MNRMPFASTALLVLALGCNATPSDHSGTPLERIHMDWEDPRLFFVAREPFISRHSTADLVTGWIGNGEELLVESTMPSGGCVFSDGIEADSVEFNSGAILHVQRSAEKARLVIA